MAADIELSRLTNGEVRSLSGQERGVAARELFSLDSFDLSPDVVTVDAQGIDAITPSFLQGMFSKSIKAAGSREAFFRHFQFSAGSAVLRQVDKAIENTLIDRSNLFAL